MAKQKKVAVALLLAAFIAVIAASYYSYNTGGIIKAIITSDIDSITAYIHSFGALAPTALVLLVVLEVIVAPIPPLLLYVTSGILFGTLFGGLLVLIGNVIGAFIAFMIARTFGERIISKRISNERKKQFDRLSKKYGLLAMFFLRLNPITSSDMFSYLAGLSKMKLSAFLIGTVLGLTPLIFAQTYLGSDIIKAHPVLLWMFVLIGFVYILIFSYLLFKPKRKK